MLEELSEENKVNWNEILQDVDIAEFCEKYLGVKLLEYQRVILRNLYKAYEKSENEFYQRAFPFSTYRFYCILYDQLKHEECKS